MNASHDALNVESNVPQQNQIGQNESWIQCKGCPKKIQEKSILLHLRSKKCKQHYNDEEYSDLLTKRDAVRKGYKKQHNKAKTNPVSNAIPESIEPTNALSNQSQQSQHDLSENWIQCKGCPKKMLEKSILLHLRSKKCRKHYSNEEYSKLITKRDERKRLYHQQYRKTNENSAQKNLAQMRQTRMNTKNNMTSKDRILAFKRDIVDGPNFVCFSCRRSLFRCSVKTLESKDIAKILNKISGNLAKETGLDNCQGLSKLILCHNCNTNFNSNKFPSTNVNNGLKLDDVPQELSILADLEQQLIAQLLIFMKIKKLPVTRMGAVDGQVISVPIESEDISR